MTGSRWQPSKQGKLWQAQPLAKQLASENCRLDMHHHLVKTALICCRDHKDGPYSK